MKSKRGGGNMNNNNNMGSNNNNLNYPSTPKSLSALDGEFDRCILYRPRRSGYEGCRGAWEH